MKKNFLIIAIASFSAITGNGVSNEFQNEEIKPIENLPKVEFSVEEEADASTLAAWEAFKEYTMDILNVINLRASVLQQANDPVLKENSFWNWSKQKQVVYSILADYGIMADSIYKWTGDERNEKIKKHSTELYKEIYYSIQLLKRKDIISNTNVSTKFGSHAKKIDMLNSKYLCITQEELKNFSEKGIDTSAFLSTLQIMTKN